MLSHIWIWMLCLHLKLSHHYDFKPLDILQQENTLCKSWIPPARVGDVLLEAFWLLMQAGIWLPRQQQSQGAHSSRVVGTRANSFPGITLNWHIKSALLPAQGSQLILPRPQRMLFLAGDNHGLLNTQRSCEKPCGTGRVLLQQLCVPYGPPHLTPHAHSTGTLAQQPPGHGDNKAVTSGSAGFEISRRRTFLR